MHTGPREVNVPIDKTRTAHRAITAYVVAAILALIAVVPQAHAQQPPPSPAIEREADQVLRSMSDYLRGLPRFRVELESDVEVLAFTGEKLQFSSSGHAVVERPGRIRAQRQGGVADAEFVYDGETLTIHERRSKVFAQYAVKGTLDDAIDRARDEIGVQLPGADLLYADVYPGLNLDVVSGRYIGVVKVQGVDCHHLAYRGTDIDWQIWIEAGDKPLPRKYVITSKWLAGAPQFAVRLSGWTIPAPIEADLFTFKPPPGTTKVEAMPINSAGEIEVVK